MSGYRPRRLQVPELSDRSLAALLGEFRSIAEESARLGARDASVRIENSRVLVRAGQYVRVSPPSGGQTVILESAKASTVGKSARLSVENPQGALTIVAAPLGDIAGTVNSVAAVTVTTAGIVELVPNGQGGWFTAGLGSGGGAPLSDANPEDVDASAASPGVSTSASRADHKHDVLVDEPVAVQLDNAEGTSDALSRADHEHGFFEPTEGYVSRTVYTASTTLTVMPRGNRFRIDVWGGGGSGAAGARNGAAGNRADGGSGGGGGAHRIEWMSREELQALLTASGGSITITVATTTTGPAGTSSNGSGTDGTLGGHSAFGPFLAFGGGGGACNANSQVSAGSGGGTMGPGTTGANANIQRAGGAPAPDQDMVTFMVANTRRLDATGGGGGCGGGNNGSVAINGGASEHGGAGGGSAGGNVNPGQGGNSVTGGAAGGGGGFVNTSNSPNTGAAGGGRTTTAGATNGSGGALGAVDTAGAPGTRQNTRVGGDGGGGGGASSTTAGAGGAGAEPSGGGGGGGGARGTSGAGGNGARGEVVIEGYP